MIAVRRILTASLLAGLAMPALAATNLWWDPAYGARFNIEVATGTNVPDKGYVGYTARISALDTQSLIAAGDMQSDCDDLRILFYDGLGWQELPRHVLGCGTASTDVRFALAADIPASDDDDNYYLYYDNAAAGAPAALTTGNVYLWFDDASIDRSASYIRGRVDAWHGSGWDNSLAWNSAGYYTYDNGDNFTSGYRLGLDERDVFIEAEFMHVGCYQLNQTTGLLVRGEIDSGTGGSESSEAYYASNRGHYPGCNGGGYTHDGNIMKSFRTVTAVDGANPPPVTPNVWRRQALAAWLTAPARLSFWDEDNSASWTAPGFPSAANLHVSGTDADVGSRGFVAVMTAQDNARLRNILVRRYVEPEPVLTLTAGTPMPTLLVQKTQQTVFDPVNNAVSPKAIPGSWVEFEITASNSGPGSVDTDGLELTEPLPANVALFVGDLGGSPPGPVDFDAGSGAAASGLSLDYGGLTDLGDDVEFSTNGSDWSYVPSPDIDGFDAAVRFLRVRPTGSFQGTNTATPTEFSIRIRVKIL